MSAAYPNYYDDKENNYDVIDLLDMFLPEDLPPCQGFMVGNIIKYLVRYTKKNGVEDLQKAAAYLDRLTRMELQRLEGVETDVCC